MTALTLHLSRSLGRRFSPGDEIVVTRMDHEGNVSPWLLLAEDLGLVVKWLPFNRDTWKIEPEDLEALLGPRTRLLALNGASNLTGSINDVAELTALARSAGAMTYVDAVQLAPHQCIDVQAIDCDFLVCSSYKLFGPHLGVLWGRRELLDDLSAYKVRCASNVSPEKWESGTPQTELLAGLAACVGHYDWLGGLVSDEGSRRGRIEAAYRAATDHEAGLVTRLIDGIRAIPGTTVHGNRQSQPGGGEGADGVDDARACSPAAGRGASRARRDLRLVRPQLRPGGRQAPRHRRRDGGGADRTRPLQHRGGGGQDAGGVGRGAGLNAALPIPHQAAHWTAAAGRIDEAINDAPSIWYIGSSQMTGEFGMVARTPASTPGLVVLRQPTLAEIRTGLPTSFLDHLKDTLEVTETQLAGVVGIARQTLVRRKSQGVLRQDEGDRAAMVAKVFNMALSYFDGNREHALEWLKHPSPALAGETPLQHADTATGAEEVMDLIGRLEHGIPT